MQISQGKTRDNTNQMNHKMLKLARDDMLPGLDQMQVHQQGNPYSWGFPCSNHKPALPKPVKTHIHMREIQLPRYIH